ncbi:hypothetical protein SETIT_2G290600v2 [Setaria italica]|uniref:Uncharacterized protein n=2 Tax=Setaria TaxID=4554 RepID=K3ZTN7_SETIT|nr:protein MCM10 homolog [Setaria italica]XP_034581854.1 protein MCM10 homolog [Setaria viridis]RCV12709.1 hypothetical protein SETIT_2G290600v2 [Setaria italica]TKW34356.1 hypothetical protein SEVIR_2G301600v2 [Setaria viridis]
MASAADDLDLLLSLGEAVPETPPSSPRAADGPGSGGAFTPPRTARPGGTDMSVFRDAVKDYLEAAPESTSRLPERPKRPKATETLVDKYSGLRIKHLTLSPLEISNRFADIRFVRITAIKNSVGSDRFSGCWATAGVLLDKGVPRVSAKGTSYSIWKMGALDETEVSLFLFGDAHVHYSGAAVGSVFALLNGNVRMDNGGKGFSVSVASVGQMFKMGVAADFSLCKGKRKDGVACTMAINKSKGAYCKFHSSKTSQKYTTGRVELKGGNFQFASKLRSEGIYMVNRSSEQPNPRKPFQPVKVMSIDGLKRALSNADRVTTKNQSQGIRFLSHVTANMDNRRSTVQSNGSTNQQQQKSKFSLNKSSSSSGAKGPPMQGLGKPEQDFKRRKVNNPPENIVELDAVSSDDDEINIVLRR